MEISTEEKIATFWTDHLSQLHRPFSSPSEALAALAAKEKELGLRLPDLFKRIYSLRDGGYTPYGSYRNDDRSLVALFDHTHWNTLADVASVNTRGGIRWMLGEDLDDEPFFLNDVRVSNIAHPERLVSLSPLWGYEELMLDYGFQDIEEKEEPAVVMFEQNELNTKDDKKGFHETLRVENFEKFFTRLVHTEEVS